MIDWARVGDLHDEIGSNGFSEVVEIFLMEAGQVVSRLREAPDHGRLENDLHFLKGGVVTLGFTQVTALCQQGESMAAEGRATDVDVAAIVQAYDVARDLFLADLPLRISCTTSAG